MAEIFEGKIGSNLFDYLAQMTRPEISFLLKKARIWTVPNQITLLRLGFLPFFLILILYEHYDWALFVLVFVALTDAVDGHLARTLHQKSALGAYLDPIADKLLLWSWFF